MFYINGKSIKDFGGRLKNEYSVTGMDISENSYTKGRNRSSVIYHGSVLGLKTITLPVDFKGKSREEAAARKSRFDAEIYGKSELVLPDGARYTAICTSLGEEAYHGRELLEVTYTCVGLRHGPLQTVVGNTVYCASTLPRTDCRITVTVGGSGSNYQIGSVVFPTVKAREVLCVDGITGRILVNGAPGAQRAEWLEFPYLVPGENEITCVDTVMVEFYPAYF